MNPFEVLFGWHSRINRAKFWVASIIQNIYAYTTLFLVGEYAARTFGTSLVSELSRAKVGHLVWLLVPAPLGIVPMIAILVMVLSWTVYTLIAHAGGASSLPADLVGIQVTILVLGLLAWLPLVLSTIAVGIRRLHDRGKSGRWLLFYYVAPILLVGLLIPWAPGGVSIGPSLLIWGWAAFELGLLRGTTGENEYGPA
jgi:uncharacterized membrane protein YhaH (DUF805 family)